MLVIQLGTWASGSNVLSEKSDLVSNLEVWMVLASAVCLLLLPLVATLALGSRPRQKGITRVRAKGKPES